MALTFGERLQDVTTDPDGLRALLEPEEPEPGAQEGGEQLLAADPDPGWEDPGLGERLAAAAKGKGGPPPQVSRAVRKDVTAKVALMGTMLTGAWMLRDPLCGQVAQDQVPAVSEALADILCDSPDVVRWFTSGGNYLKWLNLLMACQPIVAAVMAHHVFHSVGTEEEQQGPADWGNYGV